jgi:cell division protein FtsW
LEKRFYLPESHTDFIFAVISEEFGLVGGIILILVYVWLLIRAFQIGTQAKKLELYFSAYTAQGIGLWVGLQSFLHMGVNWGILPTKGLTLPLVSYGGSAVIVMLMCMGILVRIDYENRQKMQGFTI